MKRVTQSGVAFLAFLLAASAAQAWPGLLAVMREQAAVLAVMQEEDPPPEVIQHGLTMLVEGEKFSNYDLWAIAVTVESPEYTVIAETEGWIFQGGDMVKIGKDLGQYCEIGEPVGPGVYWNQSEFTVYLSNSEDSNASIKVAANGLLSIGLTTDMQATAVGPGTPPDDSDGYPPIVCHEGYSACCITSNGQSIMVCLHDTRGDFSACEGGGKGAVSCSLDGIVECRQGYYACCNPYDDPPTYLCVHAGDSADCQWGGPGTKSCGALKR